MLVLGTKTYRFLSKGLKPKMMHFPGS